MKPSTVPPPQYVTGIPAHHMTATNKWSTGLCDCTEDMSSCCLTCWCPCISFGRIAQVLDKGATTCRVSGGFYSLLCLFTSFGWIYSCMYRKKLRQEYMLREQPCYDVFVHCCCEMCALCQEYRELKNHGFELSLVYSGWEGNLVMQNQGVVMPPVGPGEMKR